MGGIPVADISAFIGDSAAEAREAAAKQLAEALRPHGCAAIVGHGLSEDVVQEMFATAREFFDLPLGEKKKAPHPDGLMPHRGYLAKEIENSGKFGTLYSESESEKAFLNTSVDWKESYDVGHEDNHDQQNIWPPDDVFPTFKPSLLKYFESLSAVSLAILEGLMLGMNLSEADCRTLRQIHWPVEHQMRIVHYLPMSLEDQNEPKKIRLAPHKDFASYTLLLQASESGLEFQNRDTKEYMLATPKEGVLYLNIGDIFERYSNGFYPSPMHRVAISSEKTVDGTIPGRYSIPYFVHINQAEEVYPMPSRVKADDKSNYEPTNYQALAAKLFAMMS